MLLNNIVLFPKNEEWRFIMRFVFLYVAFLLVPMTIGAQQISPLTIKGRVIDAESGAPLAVANVFLASTTVGTTTGKDGEFIINNVPFGTYDIIFSYVGYETEKKSFSSYKPGIFNYDISLKPKEINLNEVTVTGAVPEDWKENLEIFTKVFIGETENSRSTRILNPEVLNFVRDKSKNILKAYSDSVVRVENDALGYTLYISLDSLVYNIPDEIIKYKFYPRFDELSPADEQQRSAWENNRQKTYWFSARHFFYALVHKQLDADGFSLYKGSSVHNTLSGFVTRVSSKDLDLTTDSDSTFYTFNFTGVLKIHVLKIQSYPNSASLLDFSDLSVSIDKYGNLLEPGYSVEIYGYWSNQRIADLLPLNYIYPGK